MRCLVLRTAFACHLARRGPTPRLPACCVRLLRAQAAAAVLFRLLLPLLVVPQPALQPGLLFAGNTWDADAGPVTIAWGAITFDDVGAWTAATGQGP